MTTLAAFSALINSSLLIPKQKSELQAFILTGAINDGRAELQSPSPLATSSVADLKQFGCDGDWRQPSLHNGLKSFSEEGVYQCALPNEIIPHDHDLDVHCCNKMIAKFRAIPQFDEIAWLNDRKCTFL